MVTPKTRVFYNFLEHARGSSCVFYNFLEHARDRRVCLCPRSAGIEDIWDTNHDDEDGVRRCSEMLIQVVQQIGGTNAKI